MTKQYVSSKILVKSLLTVGLISVLASCGPQKLSYKQSVNGAGPGTEQAEPKDLPLPDAVDLELVTTYQKELIRPNPNSKYEEQDQQIRTSQAVIHLNKVKMSQVTMRYDALEKKLFVQGSAEIADENGIKINETPFQIAGTHRSDQAVLTLRGVAPTKQKSNEKPVVGAKATCIGVDDNDNVICSSVIIDFFIAYKGNIYSEQMQVKTNYKPTPKPAPKKDEAPNLEPIDNDKDEPKKSGGTTKSEDKPKTETEADKTAATDNNDENLPSSEVEATGEEEAQVEEDQAVEGRFEGQLNNPDLDLTDVLGDDEDIMKVIKPAKVVDKDKKKDGADTAKKDSDKNTDKADPKKVEPKKEDKSDKTVSPDVAITDKGEVRPVNQAIGVPHKGSLRNATSLLLKQESLTRPYFLIAEPKRARYYTTYEMAEMLTRLGEKLHINYKKSLIVGSLSQKRGGFLDPHKSHQIGMDADVAYPTETKSLFPNVVDKKTRVYYPSKISLEKTYELFKFAFKQKDLIIDRIFVDSKIKKELCDYAKEKGEINGPDKEVVDQMFRSLQHVYGHGNHFHLRLRCTPAHPACRKMVYTKQEGCK